MAADVFNLLDRSWLPVRRMSGAREWIAPAEIVSRIGEDPVVEFDWGRADFDAAAQEFMIGLLACACPPADERAWRGWRDAPPAADELARRFAPLAPAFAPFGDGPRFMQDHEDFAAEPSPASGLFIEAPGANTERNNADLFQKRGRFPALSAEAAAMALFTLQTYAPSGGAGHRTSLRGGGPLTTLALPPEGEPSLWARLWLNVEAGATVAPDDMPRVFAWLGPTVTSEGKKPPLGPDDVDPRAVYWGMPRRIRLDVEAPASPVACAVTGRETPVAVARYRTKPWGMNYAPLPHPLSPMYRQKATSAEWLFVHPQPGGLTYRHWVEMALPPRGGEPLRKAAPATLRAIERLKALRAPLARLQAAGYDMDNMKARGFVDARFPLFALADEHASERLDFAARAMVEASTTVSWSLVAALRRAGRVGEAGTADGATIAEAFQHRTQTAFFDALRDLADALGKDAEDEAAPTRTGERFLKDALAPVALDLFDAHAPLETTLSATFGEGRESRMEKAVAARLNLVWLLRGVGREGAKLFAALGLAPPAPKKGRKAA